MSEADKTPFDGMMPGGMPMMPGAMPAMPGMQQNPMLAMMQMMQMMMGQTGAMPAMDPSAVPFASGAAPKVDDDPGLDAGIIRPARITGRIKEQKAISTGSVLDYLCLTDDCKNALGGIPKGCTIAFAGPPGKGKTRTALAALARVAQSGEKVAFVVAEEGFHDTTESGRDDLCSRMTKIAMEVTGLPEAELEKSVLDKFYIMECQYHKGTSWDDFVGKYRYLVEKDRSDSW